jgi:hypothetical protein
MGCVNAFLAITLGGQKALILVKTDTSRGDAKLVRQLANGVCGG